MAVVLNTYTSTWHCATKICIYIGGATWEACSDILDIWEPPQHLLSRHRETKKENLYRGEQRERKKYNEAWFNFLKIKTMFEWLLWLKVNNKGYITDHFHFSSNLKFVLQRTLVLYFTLHNTIFGAHHKDCNRAPRLPRPVLVPICLQNVDRKYFSF